MISSTDILNFGIKTISLESKSLDQLANKLGDHFVSVVKQILENKGRVVVTGIGKSAIVGQKIVATFNSTGTPSLFMHAADAVHGDLGMVQKDDIVICISKSGNSPEIKALLPLIKQGDTILVGITGNVQSSLASASDYILDTTVEHEACPNNLAPTTSTIAQMAMGDAIAVALIECRNFKSQDFAKYHPGGALGKKLYLTLKDIADKNPTPIVEQNAGLAECIVAMTQGRMGAVLVSKDNKLLGIITDGDLRRMLAKQLDINNSIAKDIMTPEPYSLAPDMLAVEGVEFLKEKKINHIILAINDNIEGIIHIQDLIKEGLI